MAGTRRDFLRASAGVALGAALPPLGPGASAAKGDGAPAPAPSPPHVRVGPTLRNYEPWIEVDPDALRHNARQVARLSGGRPILAVVKNNAYGLGIERVGPVLDAAPEVAGLAVVKPDEALALRAAGVRKPILFMGLADRETATLLASRDVRLAPFTDDAPELLGRVAAARDRPVPIHLYIDTGMSRLGMPAHRALPWIEKVAAVPGVTVEGTFMTFTEGEFDEDQLARFRELTAACRQRGVDPGRLHAASSHGLFFRPDARLDMVRPGLTLYGAYPAGARELELAELRPALRVRARVVRVERLRPGDGVSYGRNYVAERPTWIATLPMGHADGYPRTAVRGARILIAGRTYPVIGAVSASHAIVEVGDERTVEIGDVATLVGPDDPEVHPNAIAERAEISVYDVLMRLSPVLPAPVTPDAARGTPAPRATPAGDAAR